MEADLKKELEIEKELKEALLKENKYLSEVKQDLETKFELAKYYVDGLIEDKRVLLNESHELKRLKEKICKLLTDVDIFMCTQSSMNEGEIYDIQQIFKRNGFQFNGKEQSWEFKE